jgi:hypothetical protein
VSVHATQDGGATFRVRLALSAGLTPDRGSG